MIAAAIYFAAGIAATLLWQRLSRRPRRFVQRWDPEVDDQGRLWMRSSKAGNYVVYGDYLDDVWLAGRGK